MIATTRTCHATRIVGSSFAAMALAGVLGYPGRRGDLSTPTPEFASCGGGRNYSAAQDYMEPGDPIIYVQDSSRAWPSNGSWRGRPPQPMDGIALDRRPGAWRPVRVVGQGDGSPRLADSIHRRCLFGAERRPTLGPSPRCLLRSRTVCAMTRGPRLGRGEGEPPTRRQLEDPVPQRTHAHNSTISVELCKRIRMPSTSRQPNRHDRAIRRPSMPLRRAARSPQLGSSRRTVVTRSMPRSNEAMTPIPVRSALATRYASAKSSRWTS